MIFSFQQGLLPAEFGLLRGQWHLETIGLEAFKFRVLQMLDISSTICDISVTQFFCSCLFAGGGQRDLLNSAQEVQGPPSEILGPQKNQHKGWKMHCCLGAVALVTPVFQVSRATTGWAKGFSGLQDCVVLGIKPLFGACQACILTAVLSPTAILLDFKSDLQQGTQDTNKGGDTGGIKEVCENQKSSTFSL